MTSEWDGTPWGGVAVAEPAIEGTTTNRAKAVQGWQPVWTADRVPASSLSPGPLRRMRTEQALYWSHPWVLTAENAVTRRVAGLPWHLEDENDDEVEDTTPDPRLKQIRTLLEKPQANIPIALRQIGIESWTNLVSITSRHLGLCGMTHWYFDSMDGDGIPNAILYINPARLYPRTTTTGQLVEWTLDPLDDQGRGGTALRRDEVLTFYLTPPDGGAITSGMVNAALLTTSVSTAANRHALNVFSAGGSLTGIISPKEGTIQDEQYGILTNEVRNIAEVDASKRLAVVRGPIEFHPTVANMQELDWTGLAELSRDDTFTIWGVPKSQAPAAIAAGLNSGGTKDSDEAILMQGAVHDRVRPIRETIQLGLLDRYNAQGMSPQIVIEEPTFDDRAPAYQLAALAKDLPLTRNQRLLLVGEDPLPEYGPDGQPLGLAIDMPFGLLVVGQGEESERPGKPGRFGHAPAALPPDVQPQDTGLTSTAGSRSIGALVRERRNPAKATDIRGALVRRFEPMLRKAVSAVLTAQKADVAAKVRERGEHIARKPSDRSVWWDAKRWDKALLEALSQGAVGLTQGVTTKVAAQLGQRAKAEPFAESVARAILRTVGQRVTGINETTRDEIAKQIAEAFDQGLSPGEVADLIEDATQFGPSRAELIARTETALTYNQAAIESYREYEVTQVEVIDGDSDDECIEANGSIWSLDEADADPIAHPNCVRDFSPVFGGSA